MKKIYLLLCFVACLLASCLEDKGNDLYIELNDVIRQWNSLPA